MSDTSRETVEALANWLDHVCRIKFENDAGLDWQKYGQSATTLRALLDERDHSAALVAAAYEAAAGACREHAWPEDGTHGPAYFEIESAERATVIVCETEIRALTPADAQAALDALMQKAVEAERERCARALERMPAFNKHDAIRAIREGKA